MWLPEYLYNRDTLYAIAWEHTYIFQNNCNTVQLLLVCLLVIVSMFSHFAHDWHRDHML